MSWLDERRDREQDERELKRAPTAILRDVEVSRLDVFATTTVQGIEATHALQPHGLIGESEGREGLVIFQDSGNARVESLQGTPSARQRIRRALLVTSEIAAPGLVRLLLDPLAVLGRESLERLAQCHFVEFRQALHVED